MIDQDLDLDIPTNDELLSEIGLDSYTIRRILTEAASSSFRDTKWKSVLLSYGSGLSWTDMRSSDRCETTMAESWLETVRPAPLYMRGI